MEDQEVFMVAGDEVHGDKLELSGSFVGATVIINPSAATVLPDPTTQPYIFISYSWDDDRPFVLRLHRELESAGIKVWRDETDMQSRGDSLRKEVRQAIEAATRIVPVVGPAALASNFVQLEWNYAREKCKPITAIWRLGEEMPADFRNTLYFDFRSENASFSFERVLATLIDRLKSSESLPGPIYGPFPLPPQSPIARSEFSSLINAIRPEHSSAAVTGRAAVVALHAGAGLGKTVLAAQFARDCATRRAFSDGIFWLEVGKKPNLTTLQYDIGRRFSDDISHYSDERSGKARLQQILSGRRVLIILDDVWDHRHVEALLVDASDCRWLITSRLTNIGNRLKLLPENRLSLGALSADEGANLIAGRLGLGPTAGHLDREAHRAIAITLGGHTQAIDIAAARLDPAEDHHVSATELLERFRARRESDDPFRDLKLDDEDKDTNLEISLAVSYEFLSAADRRRFRALGAFTAEGTFSREVVAAVWRESIEETQDALARLASATLLMRATDPNRYAIHTLLRAYALALLKREREDEAARERLFNHLVNEHSGLDPEQSYSSYYLDKTSAEWENIKQALKHGLHSWPKRACDFLVTLANTYMPYRLAPNARLELLSDGMQAALVSDYPLGQANLLMAIGDVKRLIDEYNEAVHNYFAALDIYRSLQYRLGGAKVWKAVGDIRLANDGFIAALENYNSALDIFHEFNAQQNEAIVLKAIGDTFLFRGSFEDAHHYYRQALDLFQVLGDPWREANCLRAIGDVLFNIGVPSAAIESYQDALAIFRSLHDPLSTASTFHAIAQSRSFDASRDHTLKTQGDMTALSLIRTIGRGATDSSSLFNEYAETSPDEFALALDAYQVALADARKRGAPLDEANTLKDIGDLESSRDRYDIALENYFAALEIYTEHSNQINRARVMHAISDVQRSQTDNLAAIDSYREALSLYREIDYLPGMAKVLQAIGFLRHQTEPAFLLPAELREALDLFRTLGDHVSRANTYLRLGTQSIRLGRSHDAESYLSNAVTIAKQADHGENLTIETWSALANYLHQQNHKEVEANPNGWIHV
jgi:tetratricopeptide (TPR) repeat protein